MDLKTWMDNLDYQVERWWAKNVSVNRAVRIRLYRKLMRFIENEMKLTRALETMWDHASDYGRKPKKPQAICINEWYQGLLDGQSLADSMQGWVPQQDRMVIDAGERGDALSGAFKNAMKMNGRMAEMAAEGRRAIALPALMIAAMSAFFWLFGSKIVPQFVGSVPVEQWGTLSTIMYYISVFVREAGLYVLIGLAALIILITLSMPFWTGKYRVYADKIPPWSLYRLHVGSGFMLGLSSMLSAGERVVDILARFKVGASPWLNERLARTLTFLNNGYNLGEALYWTGLEFPDKETVVDMQAFAELDGFNEVLENLGNEWLDESLEKVRRQRFIVFYSLFFLLAALLIINLFGMFELQQQLTQNARSM